MKRCLIIILVFAVAFSFLSLMGGCSRGSNGSGGKLDIVVGDPGTGAQSDEATLLAVFNSGAEPGDTKTHSYAYDGELTVDVLAAGLSEWTGLDFAVSASANEGDVTVDWKFDSSLFTGNSTNDEFSFFDFDSLAWFMLDSLWRTIAENLGTEDVFYTMNGGKALSLEFSPPMVFASDQPYLGSAMYIEHADLWFDDIDNLWTQLNGYWIATDNSFIGFFLVEGARMFEYGYLQSDFWISGVLIDYEFFGAEKIELTLLIPAREESAFSDESPEQELTFILDFSRLSRDGKLSTLGDEGESYTYTFGGRTLEEATNNL